MKTDGLTIRFFIRKSLIFAYKYDKMAPFTRKKEKI